MRQKGFTIIELVISIFILSVAIVGIFSAFSMMVLLTNNASDRLTAAYLAQEGVEIIRNIRDNNWIDSGYYPDTSWVRGIYSTCFPENGDGCRVDYRTMGTEDATFPIQPYDNSEYLNIDSDGFYSYGAGTDTKFRRKILAEYLSGYGYDYVIKVTVTVYWDEKPSILNPNGDPGSIVVEEYFYDWYDYNGFYEEFEP